MLCIWLGLAHFHNGYSFLMISPNLLDIWPVYFLILSRYETAHFLKVVPRRLFFAALQRIAISWKPKYYQKMRCFITRRNQKEHWPDVM